jgi:hypothetical protein
MMNNRRLRWLSCFYLLFLLFTHGIHQLGWNHPLFCNIWVILKLMSTVDVQVDSMAAMCLGINKVAYDFCCFHLDGSHQWPIYLTEAHTLREMPVMMKQLILRQPLSTKNNLVIIWYLLLNVCKGSWLGMSWTAGSSQVFMIAGQNAVPGKWGET